MQRRSLYLASALFLLGIPALLIAFRVLPEDTWGRPLYEFHDSVFLPVKGHLYNRFGAYAPVIWLILSLLLAAWLFFFVQRQSLFRPLHLQLARFAVSLPPLYPLLARSAAALAARGFRPQLLSLVVDYRRQQLLDTYAAKRGQGQLASLLALSRLHAQLLACDGPSSQRALRAALLWVELFPFLQEISEDAKSLATQIDALLTPMSTANATSLTHDALIQQTRLCLVPVEPKLAPTIQGLDLARIPPQDLKVFIGLKLQASLHRQLLILEHFKQSLEERQFNYGGAFNTIAQDPLQDLQDHLKEYGELFYGLVCVQSALWEDAKPAAQTQDLFDATRLVLALVPDDEESGIKERHLSFLGDLPLRRHHCMIANYASQSFSQEFSDWRQSGLDLGGLVTASDFHHDELRVQSHHQAAGPDFSREPVST